MLQPLAIVVVPSFVPSELNAPVRLLPDALVTELVWPLKDTLTVWPTSKSSVLAEYVLCTPSVQVT